MNIGPQQAGVFQCLQQRYPGGFVPVLEIGNGQALARIERSPFVEHDRDEIAVGAEQDLEVAANQLAQQGGRSLVSLQGQRQGLLLALDGRAHALVHHGIQQGPLALEVREGRA